MKSITVAFFCILMLNSCKNKANEQSKHVEEIAKAEYKSFGKSIISDDAIVATSMASHYKTMNVGDSIDSKIKATVNKVCKTKGCWMTLSLGDEKEVMVKFKDYGFFVPKDIAGREVIVNGKAYVKDVLVEEQRHYAEDEGKTAEEIVSITKPKRTYAFEADGVLLKQ